METGKADTPSEFLPSRTEAKHQCPGPNVQARLGLGQQVPCCPRRGREGEPAVGIGLLASNLLGASVHNQSSRKKRSPRETSSEGGDKEQRMGPDPAAELEVTADCCPRAALLLFTQLHLHRLRAPPGPESHPITREADPPTPSHCLEPGLHGPLSASLPHHLCPRALTLLFPTATAPGFILRLSSPRGSTGVSPGKVCNEKDEKIKRREREVSGIQL